MKRLWLGVLFVLWVGLAYAELKLPALFSDGMVLQRDQQVPVWGWAEPGAEVTVSFAEQKVSATAGQDGKFLVRLKKMDASKTFRGLKVSSGDELLTVENILVGEVWLCSGQSNMEWPVSKSLNFDKEKADANYPLIRMFLTKKEVASEPQSDCSGTWTVCTPENVGKFSATAYFFGRELRNELEVPIGLIRSCWGGTRIEAWSPMESLSKFPEVMSYKSEEDLKAEQFSEVAEEKRYAAAVKAREAAKANGKKVPRRTRKRKNPHQSPNYPANLYNAMINPFIPYGIQGSIWYQGEANAGSVEQAILYRDLLENMVNEWREDWGSEFPFYAVQLVNFKSAQRNPVENSGWVFSRESFLKFHKEVPNVGIAVGIDVGDGGNIHPRNKQAIGYRLAQQALAKTYGKNVVPGGPIYTSMEKNGNTIVVKFDDIGSGLVEQGGEPLKRFAIAGADKRFVLAQAVIVDNTVIVSSTEVADPVAVRYAWANNPEGCNLFNKEGFPASPFRTDDWDPMVK